MAKLTIDQIREALGRGAHIKPDDTDAADVERLIWVENKLQAMKNKRGEIVYAHRYRVDSRLSDLTNAERSEHFRAREVAWKKAQREQERPECDNCGKVADVVDGLSARCVKCAPVDVWANGEHIGDKEQVEDKVRCA